MFKPIMMAVLASSFALSPVTAQAKTDAVQTSWRNNISADGYDVVSFFSGKPQPGKTEFTTLYQGAEWRFFSQANLDLFLTNPDMFAPQYGGHCAWAIAKGKIAKGDPAYWHVEDGRLFFNYNERIQRRWDRKRAKFITRADARWPSLLKD